MAIERKVQGEVVAGVVGPIDAPSGSFQDYTSYDVTVAVGKPVMWDSGAEQLDLADRTHSHVLGICYSIAHGVCRVQTSGVYHASGVPYSINNWVFCDSTAGDFQYGDSELDMLIRYGPLVGYALAPDRLLLMCNKLPALLWEGIKAFAASNELNEEYYTLCATRNFYVSGIAQSDTAAPKLVLAQADQSVSNAQTLGSIAFTGHDDTAGGFEDIDTWEEGARIDAVAASNWHAGDAATELKFLTHDGSSLSVRATLKDDGKLGLGIELPQHAVHIVSADPARDPYNYDGLVVENAGNSQIAVVTDDGQVALAEYNDVSAGIGVFIDVEGANTDVGMTYESNSGDGKLIFNKPFQIGEGSNGEILFDDFATAYFDMDVAPAADVTHSLGAGGARWSNVHTQTVDIHASAIATLSLESDACSDTATMFLSNVGGVDKLWLDGPSGGELRVTGADALCIETAVQYTSQTYTMTTLYDISDSKPVHFLTGGNAADYMLTLPSVANLLLRVINHSGFQQQLRCGGSDQFGTGSGDLLLTIADNSIATCYSRSIGGGNVAWYVTMEAFEE